LVSSNRRSIYRNSNTLDFLKSSVIILAIMKTMVLLTAAAMAAFAPSPALAQQTYLQRLSPEVFDVVPPSARVRGNPGQMSVQRGECRSLPTADTRRRIVDVAVQEWAYFGFSLVEPEAGEDDFEPNDPGFSRLSPADSARVASSIAGYWAATPQGAGVVSSQNKAWTGPGGLGARWVAPWSAAFVSWVMCEGGLGISTQFQRAIAHHVYIDQAIRARDGSAPGAAFVAYDPGEAAVEPGDLICTSRRPAYRSLAERRRQMGEGARSHCDVVVKVDEANQRIFAIGGNVRRAVSMKVLPAVRARGKQMRPADRSANPARPRPFFAHLKLRAGSIEANAFDNTPTLKAMACGKGVERPARVAAMSSTAVGAQRC
jgi:hypothetical protein